MLRIVLLACIFVMTATFQHRPGIPSPKRIQSLLSRFDKINLRAPRFHSFKMNPVNCKQGPEDDDKSWVDNIFEPLINKYAELPESEQSMLASIYQSAYFMLCVYIGIVMVRAYKFSIEQTPGIS